MKEPTFEELKEKYFGKLVYMYPIFLSAVGLVVGLEDRNSSGLYVISILFKEKLKTLRIYHLSIITLMEDTEEGGGDEVL